MNAGLLAIVCGAGAFAGFCLGVLVMALAQIRARADATGERAFQTWLKSGKGKGERAENEETLFQLRCINTSRDGWVEKFDDKLVKAAYLNGSLERVTNHLADYAIRGNDGQS